MIIKKLRELYSVDTLSQDKGWKKLNDAIMQILTDNEDIEVDFTGVNIIDPWNCAEFKKLLKNEHVYFKFTNNEEIVHGMKIAYILEGMSEDHVKNIEIQVEKKETLEEKKIKENGNSISNSFVIEGDTAKFVVINKYTQLHSTNTLNYIDYAIEKIHKEKGITNFIIDINGISILRNVMRCIAVLILKYERDGVHINIDLDNEENINDLKLFIHKIQNEELSNKERFSIIRKSLKPNTAGIFITYKKSKALDDFGRQGNGEVISSRIALYRGAKQNNDGQTVLVFDSFNDNYFYTKQHWLVEHDNEMPDKLKYNTVEVKLDEIGYCDKFLGSKHHFLAPVQQNPNESRVVITGIDNDGRNISSLCAIPERIKAVFDDWDVEYNKKELEEAIKETRKVMQA